VPCTIQLHLRSVEPWALACATFNSSIKHSCASCCAYPAKDPAARQLVASRAVGSNADYGGGDGGVWVTAKSVSSSQHAHSSFSLVFLHHRGSCLSPGVGNRAIAICAWFIVSRSSNPSNIISFVALIWESLCKNSLSLNTSLPRFWRFYL
jgi:hypothetical protein